MNQKCDKNKSNTISTTIFSEESKVAGSVVENRINRDIFLVKSNLNLKEKVHTNSNSTANGIVLNYNIKGNAHYRSRVLDFDLKTSCNNSNIILTKGDIGETSIEKGEVSDISLIIDKDFIYKNISDCSIKEKLESSLQKNSCIRLLSKKKISHQIQILLNDIISSPSKGNLDNIFIESRVLEIIFLEFKELFLRNNAPLKLTNLKLDECDIEAIKKAKEILVQNIQNPPSIIELAKSVRLNDFKLKAGFKKVFGTTPYSLVISYRLDLAKQLLLSGEMSIAEVAQHVGYKYAGNFSTAFTKKFGILPRDITKTRKYYY